MDPQVISNLSQSPEYPKLLSFLLSEAAKLDTIEGLTGATATEIALELKSRQYAHKRLVSILEPLLNIQKQEAPNKNEYAM